MFLAFYLILVTILFLVIAGGCFVYLLMGIGQLVIGYKERNYTKKRSGWITTIITVGILSVAIYYYLRFVFS
jgi:hypothetical protein